MARNFTHFISGLAVYLTLAVLTGTSIALRISPGKFAEWLSTSYNPQKSLICFSLLTSGVLLILARAGVELSLFKFASIENIKRYVAGLPLWLLLLCTAASALGFWQYSPRCKPPEAVYFEILGTQTRYEPLSLMEVTPKQNLSIAARSPDPNVLLSCISWEYVGPAFETLGEKSGCQINLKFSERSGSSFITLVTTQNFCSQQSIFSIEVKVKDN